MPRWPLVACAVLFAVAAASAARLAPHVAESLCAMQSVAVAHGEPFYTDPADGATATIHAPLYYVVLGAVLAPLPEGTDPVLAGRALSGLALLATAVAVRAFHAREAASSDEAHPGVAPALLLLAVGAPAAVVARCDGLAACLALGSALLSIDGAERGRLPRAALGAALGVLAAATKQPLAWMPLFALGLAATRGARFAVRVAVAAAATGVLAALLLARVAGPFGWFYAVSVPRSHPTSAAVALANVRDAWPHLLATLGLPLLLALRGPRARLRDPRLALLLVAHALALYAAAKLGARANAFLAAGFLALPFVARALRDEGPRVRAGAALLVGAVALASVGGQAHASIVTGPAREAWLARVDAGIAAATSGSRVYCTEAVVALRRGTFAPLSFEATLDVLAVAPNALDGYVRSLASGRFDAIVVVHVPEYEPGYSLLERLLRARGWSEARRLAPAWRSTVPHWREPEVRIFVPPGSTGRGE